MPFGEWIKTDLKPLLFDHLSLFNAQNPTFLNMNFIEKTYKNHADGTENHGFFLWKLLNFVIWANQKKVMVK